MRLNIGLTTDQYDLLQFFHLFHKSIQKHFRLMPRFHWSQKVHFFHQTCRMTIKYSLKLILKNSGRFRWFLCLKSITFNVRFRHFLTGNLGHSTSLMKKQMHFFDQWYLGFNLKCFEIFFVVCIGEKFDITASACLSWTYVATSSWPLYWSAVDPSHTWDKVVHMAKIQVKWAGYHSFPTVNLSLPHPTHS